MKRVCNGNPDRQSATRMAVREAAPGQSWTKLQALVPVVVESKRDERSFDAKSNCHQPPGVSSAPRGCVRQAGEPISEYGDRFQRNAARQRQEPLGADALGSPGG